MLTHLLLLLLRCFDDAGVGLPGLAKVVEQGEGVYEEGQVDSGERQMCSRVKEKDRNRIEKDRTATQSVSTVKEKKNKEIFCVFILNESTT